MVRHSFRCSCDVACNPSRTGMEMSISSTSGSRRLSTRPSGMSNAFRQHALRILAASSASRARSSAVPHVPISPYVRSRIAVRRGRSAILRRVPPKSARRRRDVPQSREWQSIRSRSTRRTRFLLETAATLSASPIRQLGKLTTSARESHSYLPRIRSEY